MWLNILASTSNNSKPKEVLLNLDKFESITTGDIQRDNYIILKGATTQILYFASASEARIMFLTIKEKLKEVNNYGKL